MPVSAIIFLLIYFTGLILTFRHPYFGVATYIFEWHNHPPYMWWGSGLPDLRWSLLVSVVTLISLIINYKKLKPLRGASYKLIWWLVALTIWMYFVSAFYAIDAHRSFRKAEIFYKLTIHHSGLFNDAHSQRNQAFPVCDLGYAAGSRQFRENRLRTGLESKSWGYRSEFHRRKRHFRPCCVHAAVFRIVFFNRA